MDTPTIKNADEMGKLLVLTALSGKLDSVSDILDGVADMSDLLEGDEKVIDSSLMQAVLSSIEVLTETIQQKMDETLTAMQEQPESGSGDEATED